MGSIFLSYRREDSEGQAGRLYDDLVAVFGSDSVFMDVAAIQPGRDFRKSIDQSLNSCGVFLSLIGKSWLIAKDTSGQRRLDDPADFVRIETGAALKRDIPVIPVLVQGASAPKPDQLPDDLKELAFRNAVELTHPRWDSDIQVLITALRPHISQSGPKPEPERVQPGSKLRATKSLAVIAVLLVIVIGLAFYLRTVKKVVDKSPPGTTTSAAVDSSVPGPIKRSPEKVVSPPTTTNAAPIGVEDFSLVGRQERQCLIADLGTGDVGLVAYNKFATYSISAVILPLTSFNVTVSTPVSFTLSKVTESPSSSTRLKSQVSDFASFLKRNWIFPPAASTFPLRRRFASQSLLSEAVI